MPGRDASATAKCWGSGRFAWQPPLEVDRQIQHTLQLNRECSVNAVADIPCQRGDRSFILVGPLKHMT
jgi:hypothetical protein